MKKNVWRVAPEHDLEDLMQDAYMFFLTCRDQYPLVTEPQHFMSLFQRCLFNHICYLSSLRTKKREHLAGDISEEGVASFALDGDLTLDVEMKLLLEDAPEMVLQLLDKVTKAEKPYRMRKRNECRESTNSYFCRILKLDPKKFDVRTVFETWLKGEACSV